MRILHVVESFSTGVFTVIKQLSNSMAAQGDTIAIAHAIRWETPKDYRAQLDPRVSLFCINMTREIRPWSDLVAIGKVLSCMRKFKPEVVHTHSSKGGVIGRVATSLYRLSGARPALFYSPHAFSFLRDDVSSWKRNVFLFIERMAGWCGGVVVGCSEGEGRVARDLLGAPRVEVIENGVDCSEITPADEIYEGTCTVVTVGRVSPQKDPGMFAALARLLAPSGIKCVWIGGGDSRGEGELRSSGVSLTGWVERAAAVDALRRGQVYAQTSRWEGLPISVIEGMLAGLPAVVTDVVGNRDVVEEGRTGFIVRSADEMASRIRLLAEQPELRRSMGANAREMALKRFSLDHFVARWRSLYAAHAGQSAEHR